jgi:hypothetical protein
MELTSLWSSSIDAWFLLGVGLIQAVAAFCGIFLIDWSKNFRNIARYPQDSALPQILPLGKGFKRVMERSLGQETHAAGVYGA